MTYVTAVVVRLPDGRVCVATKATELVGRQVEAILHVCPAAHPYVVQQAEHQLALYEAHKASILNRGDP